MNMHFNPASTPLRIGYVLKRFPRLSETFILNEILELERRGVEVEIYSLFKPPPEARHELLSQLKARVTYLPDTSPLNGMTIKTATHAAEAPVRVSLGEAAGQPGFEDIIPDRSPEDVMALMLKASALALLAKSAQLHHLHAHFGSDAATVALLAGRIGRLPFSYTAHAKDIYHTYTDELTDNKMRRAKMNEASFVVTVSDFNRNHLQGIAGPGSPARIHRLYNGIDLDRFAFVTEGREPRSILSVGRLVEKKGFSDLIDACRILNDAGIAFVCDIVGDGPMENALASKVVELGLADKVRLRGSLRQEDVVTLMRKATVFALPCIVTQSGDRDGLPTVLLEALASGLPSISTEISGIPEIIADGETGLVVAPGNPEALAKGIEWVLASKPMQSLFATQGREKAERDFNLKKSAETLHHLFQQSSKQEFKLSGRLNETVLRFG